MTLKERLKSEESRLGKFLKKWVSLFFLFCSILGGANEYLALVPPDIIPTWAKTSIFVAGLISYVAGKLTTNLNESNS